MIVALILMVAICTEWNERPMQVTHRPILAAGWFHVSTAH